MQTGCIVKESKRGKTVLSVNHTGYLPIHIQVPRQRAGSCLGFKISKSHALNTAQETNHIASSEVFKWLIELLNYRTILSRECQAQGIFNRTSLNAARRWILILIVNYNTPPSNITSIFLFGEASVSLLFYGHATHCKKSPCLDSKPISVFV